MRVVQVISAQSEQPPSGWGQDSIRLSDLVCVCVCAKPLGPRRQSPPVSSESAALSHSQCLPRTNRVNRACFRVCVCVRNPSLSEAEPARVIRVISAQPFTMTSHRQSGGRSVSCPSRLGPVTSGNRSREPCSPDFEFQGQCRTADSRDLGPTHSD